MVVNKLEPDLKFDESGETLEVGFLSLDELFFVSSTLITLIT